MPAAACPMTDSATSNVMGCGDHTAEQSHRAIAQWHSTVGLALYLHVVQIRFDTAVWCQLHNDPQPAVRAIVTHAQDVHDVWMRRYGAQQLALLVNRLRIQRISSGYLHCNLSASVHRREHFAKRATRHLATALDACVRNASQKFLRMGSHAGEEHLSE